ncbi:AtzG-like protein [Methylobacterium oryzae]|uniref:DUF4089 domain-containing protein n=1 Tax=Methylobacterium oryzae TaxID=334852 RepID=A0ABU7TRS8_9HYPH
MPETRTPYEPESYAAAAAALLGLVLDPAWIAPVNANLRVLAAAAELVEAFPLADEIDAAPRFEA